MILSVASVANVVKNYIQVFSYTFMQCLVCCLLMKTSKSVIKEWSVINKCKISINASKILFLPKRTKIIRDDVKLMYRRLHKR